MATTQMLPPDAPKLATLYRLVILFLGVALLAGVIGGIALAVVEKEIPQGVLALASTAGGALIGVLAPSPHND